jgi:uncharacterized lipoprotein YddW (UPF0748 family)
MRTTWRFLAVILVLVSAPVAHDARGQIAPPRYRAGTEADTGRGGSVAAAVALPAEPRAVWVVRDALTSRKKIERMIAEAGAAGVTDLLIQVRGRGDAYYESSVEPPPASLVRSWSRGGRFDPLRTVLSRAHERGIRVHAWLNVYLVAGKAKPPPGHVLRSHPEWAAVDAAGRSMTEIPFRELKAGGTEGVFLSPGRTDVMRHFLAVVDELLTRYPLDGIHLDYCRYPKLDAGYGATMRAGFRRLTGFDPLQLKHHEARIERVVGRRGLVRLHRQWLRFKADQVTALVTEVRRLARRKRPDLVLSAAVKPDSETAYARFGQDWVRWVREDLVDVVAPMMYSTSRKTVARQARRLIELVPAPRVWAGISVYNQSLDAAAAKIRIVRDTGLRGYSIFSYNSIPGGGKGLEALNRAR